jgi:DNA mismatch endonuclease (patch repair protein)
MRRISSKNTGPEILVRRALHKMGYRFRLHRRGLPGRPDIILPRYRTTVFVHGCFWHRHSGCKQCTTPRSNVRYWTPKLKGNQKRDEEHRSSLRKLGWKVVIIWACEATNPIKLRKRLSKAGFLDRATSRRRQRLSRREIVGSRPSPIRRARKRRP